MKQSEARQIRRARVRRIRKIIARYNRVTCSEKEAIRYLVKFHRTHGNLFQCACGNSELPEGHCTRKLKCSVCKRDWWITAGTLFDRVKKLRPYVIAIILKMNGMDVIPAELSLVTGVADSTASEILKRVAMVVLDEMIGQFQEFSTLSLLGLYNRRSIATPSFSHPRAEEEPFQLKVPTEPVEESRAEGATGVNLSPQDALVYNEISTESVSFNVLLARTRLSTQDLSLSVISLQLVGLIEPVAGERYRRLEADVGPVGRPPATKESADSKTVVKVDEIESFKSYIIGLHGGISRKYSQLYAANYWCVMDQERWGDGALMLACLRSEAKTRDDILKYISPGIIRVLPLRTRATE